MMSQKITSYFYIFDCVEVENMLQNGRIVHFGIWMFSKFRRNSG